MSYQLIIQSETCLYLLVNDMIGIVQLIKILSSEKSISRHHNEKKLKWQKKKGGETEREIRSFLSPGKFNSLNYALEERW